MSKRALVAGVGINDADYPVTWRADGKKKFCPFYKRWLAMIQRAYNPGSLVRHPTYVGSKVVDEWLTFSVFKRWMEGQAWLGKELDKDLLIPGNKVYGPETCVFVPSSVNNLITLCNASRGELPLGVNYQKKPKAMVNELTKPYTARAGGGSLRQGGMFETAAEAHAEWQRIKADQIDAVVKNLDRALDAKVAKALTGRAAMLREHRAKGIETKSL